VLRQLPLISGSLANCSRLNLPQACQTIRGITESGDGLLERFTWALPSEERAVQVADEYSLERELSTGGPAYEEVLRRDHTGPSEQRRQRLLALAPRDRELVKDLHERYSGGCQLCAFDSPVVYGTPSAEAHHIVYLSRGGEDSLENMVLICPNHHTVIHKTDATFDYSHLKFLFPNGRAEPLCLNSHLSAPSTSFTATPGTSGSGYRPADTDRQTLTKLIQSELTPDLLTPEWAKSRRECDHPLTGYCYVASEALYHLAGGANAGLSIYRCNLGRGRTHWWLADSDGRIVDATSEQFNEPLPYPTGRRTHFLSVKPSARASLLIAKVQAHLARP
jgi:5-methylcytosine-specific restriction endonuclease McrA